MQVLDNIQMKMREKRDSGHVMAFPSHPSSPLTLPLPPPPFIFPFPPILRMRCHATTSGRVHLIRVPSGSVSSFTRGQVSVDRLDRAFTADEDNTTFSNIYAHRKAIRRVTSSTDGKAWSVKPYADSFAWNASAAYVRLPGAEAWEPGVTFPCPYALQSPGAPRCIATPCARAPRFTSEPLDCGGGG